jgi:hypothetical protein
VSVLAPLDPDWDVDPATLAEMIHHTAAVLFNWHAPPRTPTA